MEPNQEVQSEDTPHVEEPKKEVITPRKNPNPRKALALRCSPGSLASWFLSLAEWL